MKLLFNTIRQPDPEVHPGRSITFVKILHPNGETFAIGEAIKRSDEPFNKIVGFKYAITNALKNIDKQDRAIVWEAFFNHSKKTQKILA